LTFTAIRRLGAHEEYEPEAIEMLLAADIGDDSKMADEMCGAVDYMGIKKGICRQTKFEFFWTNW